MTHASVFSGIGGPEVAATMLGWQNLFHCEINPFGRAVLDYWYPNSKSYEDITQTDFTEWRGRVNVLTGGFPCQPFSFAGKRAGADDDRYLWPHMHRCINEIQPDWVVAENVGGILTMVEQGSSFEVASAPSLFDEDDTIHRYEYRGTFTLERICHDIEADGYEVQPILIPACAVGAPHRRDRVFIVARNQRNGGRGSSQGSEEYADGRTSEYASSRRNETANHSSWSAQNERESIGGIDCGASSDTNGNRRSKVDESLEPKFTDGAKPFGNGRKWDASNSVGSRWQYRNGRFLPSVSPIYGGSYGFPINVDNLTIPFTKWKNESIKAYGNAIVPQVMYEIFRAIEIVETPAR